jgi:alpha-tubulin suppressor-like RCC1 family protein
VLSWGARGLRGPDPFGRPKTLVDFLLGRDVSEDVDGIPTVVPRLARVRGLATSSVHACAVVGRDVQCWGSNELGQLGRGSFNPAPSVFQLPPSFLPDISNLRFVADAEKTDGGVLEKDVPIQVAVADEHSCAVMGSGRVYCWGKKGSVGVLGSGSTEDINGTPTRIDGLSEPAVGIASAASSVCVLLRSGAVECWGANSQGQLGTGTTDDLPHPTPSRVVLPN